MNTTVRVQLALAALGAGLVHLAVAAGQGWPLGTAFSICGTAELVWAGLAIARPAPPLVRLVPVLALAPIAAWAVELSTSTATTVTLPLFSLMIATLLDLVVAIGGAVVMRRTISQKGDPKTSNGLGFTVALVVGAFAVSALTLPALSATTAGIAASNGPHSMHVTGADLKIADSHLGH